jgi:hypothetical protein
MISSGNPLFHCSAIPLFHDLDKKECMKKQTVFLYSSNHVEMKKIALT